MFTETDLEKYGVETVKEFFEAIADGERAFTEGLPAHPTNLQTIGNLEQQAKLAAVSAFHVWLRVRGMRDAVRAKEAS